MGRPRRTDGKPRSPPRRSRRFPAEADPMARRGPELNGPADRSSAGPADRSSAGAGDPTGGSRTCRVHPAGSGWLVAPGRAANSAGRGSRCARDSRRGDPAARNRTRARPRAVARSGPSARHPILTRGSAAGWSPARNLAGRNLAGRKLAGRSPVPTGRIRPSPGRNFAPGRSPAGLFARREACRRRLARRGGCRSARLADSPARQGRRIRRAPEVSPSCP